VEARAAVSACRYPPRGTRSVGIGRAQAYGSGLADAIASAHEQLAVMLQIESAAAVEEIDEILAIDGVDCAVVGPFDLSASLGHVGALNHPDVVAAMRRVADACKNAGKPAGLFAGSVEFAKQWQPEGFSVIAVGADAAMLSNAADVQLRALRS
jgi:2-keto-3-deoxy-L-rhamnonate aldolase RhmA